jgi:hypothetical protein
MGKVSRPALAGEGVDLRRRRARRRRRSRSAARAPSVAAAARPPAARGVGLHATRPRRERAGCDPRALLLERGRAAAVFVKGLTVLSSTRRTRWARAACSRRAARAAAGREGVALHEVVQPPGLGARAGPQGLLPGREGGELVGDDALRLRGEGVSVVGRGEVAGGGRGGWARELRRGRGRWRGRGRGGGARPWRCSDEAVRGAMASGEDSRGAGPRCCRGRRGPRRPR